MRHVELSRTEADRKRKRQPGRGAAGQCGVIGRELRMKRRETPHEEDKMTITDHDLAELTLPAGETEPSCTESLPCLVFSSSRD